MVEQGAAPVHPTGWTRRPASPYDDAVEGLQSAAKTVLARLSQMMDPVMLALERLHLLLRQQLDALGVPFDSQEAVLWAGLALGLFLLLRLTGGWLRMLLLALAALVAAKSYGLLPGG